MGESDVDNDPIPAFPSPSCAFPGLPAPIAAEASRATSARVTTHIDVTDAARRVKAPTLVLHARDDQRPPFAQGQLLGDLIPGARFVALEGTNHILLEDESAWPVLLTGMESFLVAPGGAGGPGAPRP